MECVPFLTKTAKANSKSNSLRTTIPKEIVRHFELKIHDVLVWKIEHGVLVIEKWGKDDKKPNV